MTQGLRGPQAFNIVDLIMLSECMPRRQSRKLIRLWTGPWRVVARVGEDIYQIKWRHRRRKFLIVHANRLKLFREAEGTAQERQGSGRQRGEDTGHNPSPSGDAELDVLDEVAGRGSRDFMRPTDG